MICKDGTDWQPTDEQLLGWQHAYPEVDVFAELNVMAVWLDSNEPKRKTERGMPRFINSWLSKASSVDRADVVQPPEGQGVSRVRTELSSGQYDGSGGALSEAPENDNGELPSVAEFQLGRQ